MILGHRIALKLNKKQEIHLEKCAGTARFAYNWALDRMDQHWQTQKDLPKENRTYISERGFVSFNIEVDENILHFKTAENQGEVVGLDVGLKHAAVLSNGETHESPKALRKAQQKMRRLQRSLSRRQKGSNRRGKQKQRIARLHARIANIRRDFTHKLTTSIAERFGTVCVETLNVKGMMKNRKLAFSLADASLSEMKRQLACKLPLRGGTLVEADRFFPSSQLCSTCGWRHQNLKLSEREWACHDCGTIHDRDHNAATNLEAYAVSYTVKAPGQISSGRRLA